MWPSPMRPWDHVRALAAHAETTGWDGLYFADHFMPNDADGDRALDGDTLECWSVVAAVASITNRVRLGSLVSGNTYRHPAVLAKTVSTIDNISNGRVVL